MTIIRVGLDTSKHVFQIHGVDENEKPALQRQLRMLINAIRGHAAEFGLTVAKGPKQVNEVRRSIPHRKTGNFPLCRAFEPAVPPAGCRRA
jgi:hypothetical protein